MPGWFEVTVTIHHFTKWVKSVSYCFLEPWDWVLLSQQEWFLNPMSLRCLQNLEKFKGNPYVRNPSRMTVSIKRGHPCNNIRKWTNRALLLKKNSLPSSEAMLKEIWDCVWVPLLSLRNHPLFSLRLSVFLFTLTLGEICEVELQFSIRSWADSLE